MFLKFNNLGLFCLKGNSLASLTRLQSRCCLEPPCSEGLTGAGESAYRKACSLGYWLETSFL